MFIFCLIFTDFSVIESRYSNYWEIFILPDLWLVPLLLFFYIFWIRIDCLHTLDFFKKLYIYYYILCVWYKDNYVIADH